MAKLYVKGFGFACGIVGAGLALIVGTLNIVFYLQSELNNSLSMIYLGYKPTLFNIMLNTGVCFAFAFCLGSAIAWLYNRFIEESRQEIDEKIKDVARSLWEAKGKPEGSSVEDWREAERKIRGFNIG